MQITTEMLEERKAQAIATRDQHLAGANAANGVIADCDHWLAVLSKEDGKVVPAAPEDAFGIPVDNEGAKPV
jgi:hypothetical protein